MPWRPPLGGGVASSKEVQVSPKAKQVKVIQKSRQPVSQKPASQLEVPWPPQLGGPVASSKEVQARSVSQPVTSSIKKRVSRKPKQVESQPQVGGYMASSNEVPVSQKIEPSRKSAISRISLSARIQSFSRKCPGGHNYLGQWRRRRKSKSAENRNNLKVSHKSSQSVSQKQVSQPEVPWRPQLGGPVASAN